MNDIICREKYFNILDKRYTKYQKKVFLSELAKDFENLGYKAEIVIEQLEKKKSHVLLVGDISRAKKLISVCYDTPQYGFDWFKDEVFNFKKRKLVNSHLFAIRSIIFALTSSIIFYLGIQYIWNDGNFNIFDFILASSIIFTIILSTRINGFTKGNNKITNTNSIIFALSYANKYKDCAFMFTDYGYTGYEVDQKLSEAFKKVKDSKLIIILDKCNEKGNIIISCNKDNLKYVKDVNLKKIIIETDDSIVTKYPKCIGISVELGTKNIESELLELIKKTKV